MVDGSALELSGIVFVASTMLVAENLLKRVGLLVLLSVPVLCYSLAVTFNWFLPWSLALALGAFFFGGAVFSLYAPPRLEPFHAALAAILAGTGIWAIHEQLLGSQEFGAYAIPAITFGICGVLFWRLYRRTSSGVIAVSGGFLAWGAVFPIAAALRHLAPSVHVSLDLWNVPKFFVAFGMVLTILEDKSAIIEFASTRAQAENLLLQRLSQITSRLLAGKDPAALCGEVAAAVTEASSFSRAALLLIGEDRRLHVAGSNGFSPEAIEKLQQLATQYTTDKLKALYQNGSRLGSNSYRVADAENEVLIPLVSWRGSHLGCLYLLGSKRQVVAQASEMVKLEVLASDLAVTIENMRLHHRLVRSEKLAALGQLVAGVAHELNNPLTGIIGYTELLGQELKGEQAVKRVHKLANEARRMQRIVDGLLRFGRQNNPASRAADPEAALHDVVQLREYHLRKRGIHVDLQVEPMLPPLGIGEDELKQILLNIFNNAIDAVEDSAQREIRIRASQQGGRVVIQFEDSGPGFTDQNRAFDPFYTTKPVGKGTGLGLSICYGIAHECGGDITLSNKRPYGASVVVELPVAVEQPVALPA